MPSRPAATTTRTRRHNRYSRGLVAADIIRTVAVRPTLQGVLLLGMIVLIRTFPSMALQVELDGRWPWQRASVTN